MSKIYPIGAPDSDPPGKHEISQRKGWDMIRRHRESKAERTLDATGIEWDTLSFHWEALQRMMKQSKKGKIVRMHLAVNDEGETTIVLSPADADGHDLTGGGIVLLDDGTPCPPTCPDDPPPPDPKNP